MQPSYLCNRVPVVKGSLGFRVLGQSGALGLRALCFRPYEGWCRLVSGIRLCEAKTQLPLRPRGQDRWPCTDELLRLCQSKFLRSTTAVTSNWWRKVSLAFPLTSPSGATSTRAILASHLSSSSRFSPSCCFTARAKSQSTTATDFSNSSAYLFASRRWQEMISHPG